MDEAYSRIENNDLLGANIYLEIASALAIAEKNDKKLLNVQLSKGVLYIYEGDFTSYGKHILSLRKVVSDDIYNSLNKIYETGIHLDNQSSKLKYSSRLALDSGHYQIALSLARKIQPQDSESLIIINKAKSEIEKISGEYLLNNGSYMNALEYFEKEKDEAEKGRTYLAISKSLEDSNEIEAAKIAEKFGFSCLINTIVDEPNQPKANLYLALYLLDKGDKNQAKEAIRRGLNSQTTNDLITSKLLNLSENL